MPCGANSFIRFATVIGIHRVIAFFCRRPSPQEAASHIRG